MSPVDLLGAADIVAYVLLFAIAAGETSAFLGLLVPGEIALLTAGILASQGHLHPAPSIGVAVVGALVGDQIGYGLGHRYGFRWIDRFAARPRWRGQLLRVRGWTSGRYAGLAVIAGRFVGYVRPLVPFAAGAAGMGYRRFLAYSGPAAITWGGGSVLIGIAFGASGESLVQRFGIGAAIVLAIALAVLFAIYRIRRVRRRRTLPSTVDSVQDADEVREPVGRV